MRALTVVAPYSPGYFLERVLPSLAELEPIEQILIVTQEPVQFEAHKVHVLTAAAFPSHETLHLLLDRIRTEYLLFLTSSRHISIKPQDLENVLGAAESTKAGLVYSDFWEESGAGKTIHPLNDYQQGSVRDDFDFGTMMLFSVPAIRRAMEKDGLTPGVRFAGLYDLRLKVSIDHPVFHVHQPLYCVVAADASSLTAGAIHAVPAGRQESPLQEKIFAYVDPRNVAAQKEMETVFTDYLRRIGAYVAPHRLREMERTPEPFPAEASVVIPVRNRRETVAEAVKSALSQETDFPFNVIVVDNHSADGTTAVLSDLARQHPRLRHIIPVRTDLGIGGCWNEALGNNICGRYAVQLDSDDLYSSSFSLQKLVDLLRKGNYAMGIGSYTLVNQILEEIHPGVIDHREWTEDNGHNNALRINGLGAPRAFDTGLMRKIGFQNVSYGEDYAAALRICREYRIGRIYDSLYLCRRWPGNTDAGLGIEEANRNDAFKDKIRTDEIAARQKMNKAQSLKVEG